MGLSANGSMGLGGHGEGFEQQNQGVTRRQPGEGPKVNGGRTMGLDETELELIDDPEWSVDHKTFGTTDPETGNIKVQISNRHPMDILRTIAHELSHSKNGDTDGETGSDEENRANAEAGEQLRDLADEMPEMFKECFMGIRDSDVLDKQDPFRGPGGDEVNEESGEDREYREHGKSLRRAGLDRKSSRKIAAAIASDHRREDPNYYRHEDSPSLKEFFSRGRD